MNTGTGRSPGTSYFRIADQLTGDEPRYPRRARDLVDSEVLRHGGHLVLLDSAAEMAGLVAAFLSSDNWPSYPPTDPAT